MRTTRRPHRHFLVLAAVFAAAAFATTGTAAADPIPSLGSSQSCVGVSGGFLLQIVGFGDNFPPDTGGTTTFTFADGEVFIRAATTSAEGIFHTAPIVLDLRDPLIAALVGTSVSESASFGPAEASFNFTLVGCSAAPAPSDRADCKHGGWESYPALGFLNQGDCVSFVATDGKNEPGKNQP